MYRIGIIVKFGSNAILYQVIFKHRGSHQVS